MKFRETLFIPFGILKEKPKFLLLYAILIILWLGRLLVNLPEFVLGFWVGLWLGVVWLIFEGVAGIFVLGMYPFMVKDYLEKKEISFKEAFSFSHHKFGSLLGAYLFVGLIIVLINMVSFSFMPLFPIIVNTVRGIVECLILVLFCYSASVIIMDNVRAWEGIKKSVGVAKRNYPFTFLILLIPTIVGIALGEIVWEMHFGVSATIYEILLIMSVIYLFVGAWVKITIPYVYYNLKLSNTSNVQHA